MTRRARTCLAFLAAACAAAPAVAQLRVVEWNVTNYSGGRVADFQTAVYADFLGRSLSPDIIIGQEFTSATAVAQFRSLLNSAPGSPGDWAAAPFVDGPDTNNAFFYRTSKVEFLGVTTVSAGGGPPNHPRNVERYDVRLAGYQSGSAVLACYSSHMKAGASQDDMNRRMTEAAAIRDDAETLPPAWHFLLGSDLNIQGSPETAYQMLVGRRANDDGRFWDPIRTPGNWNNNFVYRFVHTQDPAGAGGMDDRYDQILVSADLIDNVGFDYIGDANVTYSLTTWNDPNHSYRAWGNDGTSFDGSLRVQGNGMVGPVIAQALIDSAAGAGHLPVLIELRVPPRIGSETELDFGVVPQRAIARRTLHVENAGDVGLWTARGIADLHYSLDAVSGFNGPSGPFAAPPGEANEHLFEMDTSTPGPREATLLIPSDDPEQPLRQVRLIGEVVACDACDANCDGAVDAFDVEPFIALLLGGAQPCSLCGGDINGDGAIDAFDIEPFVQCLTGP